LARRKTRVKDKWREKKWITVIAPDSFNNVPVAYVPITDEENAIGRVIDLTLFDILKGEQVQSKKMDPFDAAEKISKSITK